MECHFYIESEVEENAGLHRKKKCNWHYTTLLLSSATVQYTQMKYHNYQQRNKIWMVASVTPRGVQLGNAASLGGNDPSVIPDVVGISVTRVRV